MQQITIGQETELIFVEYALRNTGSPMGVADYSLSKTLPKSLKGLLPSSKEIIEHLSYLAKQ